MSHETSKATKRRKSNRFEFWNNIFRGRVLDVGCGDDPLNHMDWDKITELKTMDKGDGDANKIDMYRHVYDGFDCIHGSQVMEHLFDPENFIRRCLQILNPGGTIVMTVPDFDLYEQGHWPSKWNPDHKTTWSLWRLQPPVRTPHVFVPHLIRKFPYSECSLQANNYDWMKHGTDQTWVAANGVEAFIEIVIPKP